MTKKLYRIRQPFTYPPTGRVYAENEVDSLSDWHPADIKAAIPTLIELTKLPVGVEPALTEEDSTDVKNIGP